MRYLCIVVCLLVLSSSLPEGSGRDVPDLRIVHSFRIYLVDGKPEPADLQEKANLNDLKLEKTPLITDNDILAYRWKSHTIELKAESFERFKRHIVNGPNQELPVPDSEDLWYAGTAGTVFVVVVNGDPAYFGEFTSPAVSNQRSFPVIDLSFEVPGDPMPENAIRIELRIDPENGKDPRGQEWIKSALKILGKLR